MFARSTQGSRWIGALGSLLLAGTLAQAQVELTSDRAKVPSRGECRLRAEVDRPGRAWRWRVEGLAGFSEVLRPLTATEARFTAPPTRLGGQVTVVLEDAENPSIRGECRIQVLPGTGQGADGSPGDAFVAGSFRPSLSPFRGDPGAPAEQPPAAGIRFCEEPFREGPESMRRLHRCWIVASGQGLQAFDATGAPVPVPGAGRPCQALAVLPPGPDASPEAAPRLVYAAAVEGATRLFAVDPSGTHRELAPEGFQDGQRQGPVRDLALDRAGNVFVAFQGDWRLWRIGLDGEAGLHARIPAAPGDSAGILALALDPAGGDLYVGDRSGVRRVSAAGAVGDLLEGLAGAGHLALHGRELLVGGGGSGLRVYHLDNRRQVRLLGGAAGLVRFGPIRQLNPELAPERCAVLAGAGPLASNRGGLVLLAVGNGFALLDLPGGDLTRAVAAAQAGRTAPSAQGSARQQRLERSRTFQREARQYKQAQRLARRLEAGAAAEAQALRAGLADLDRRRGAPCGRASSGGRAGQVRGGLFCLALLGLRYLSDPSAAAALAQPGPDPRIASYTAETQAGLDRLRQACASPRVAGWSLAACDADYGTGLAAQLEDIRQQMVRLFVDPAVLGAGECLAGEPRDLAKTRLALYESGIESEYDGLVNDAASLEYQLLRDGFVIDTVGSGLLAGQALAVGAAGNMTGPATLPAFILGSVGHSLSAAGFGVKAFGTVYGGISSEAIRLKAKYLRWAIRQAPAVLADCRGVPAAPGPAPAQPGIPESPLPVLQKALAKLVAGCAQAGQRGLSLGVCSQDTLAELSDRNGTLADLGAGLPCVATGLLAPGAPRGSQGACPRESLADDALRSVTFSYFGEYLAETSAAAYKVITIANLLFAASEGLAEAALAALEGGSLRAAAGLETADAGLVTLGNGLFADGYDLLRIAARTGRWVADLTLAFNAVSLARLDDQERAGSSSSSTGGAPAGSSGAAAPVALASLPAAAAAAPAEAAPRAPLPSASAAARARPVRFRDLLGFLAPGHGEL